MNQPQNPHQKIDHRRDQQPRSHKAAHVAVVRDEAVGELPESIDKIESRANDSQLRGLNIPPSISGCLTTLIAILHT